MQLLSAGLPPRTEHDAAAQIMAGARPPEGAPVTAQTMGDTLQHASTAFLLTCSVCSWALSVWIPYRSHFQAHCLLGNLMCFFGIANFELLLFA